jgi:hypothetical protein
VTDAGAARPADGHAAGFSELKQARVRVVPADGDAAPGKRDRRAGAGRTS